MFSKNEMMAKLMLGTAQFGLDYGISNESGQTSRLDVEQILLLAKQAGLKYLDTATSYGESEQVLAAYGAGQHFSIVTKTLPLSGPGGANIDSIKTGLEQSFHQLGPVYGLLVPCANDLLSKQGEALFELIQTSQRLGWAKKIGVSVHHPQEAHELLKHFDVDLLQVPLNLLDQRFTQSSFVELVQKKQIKVHARSPFLQGLLLLKPDQLPPYFKPFKPVLQRYHDFLKQHQASALGVALNFCLLQVHVSRVVVGVNSPAQFKQLIDVVSPTALPSGAGGAISYAALASEELGLINPDLWEH